MSSIVLVLSVDDDDVAVDATAKENVDGVDEVSRMNGVEERRPEYFSLAYLGVILFYQSLIFACESHTLVTLSSAIILPSNPLVTANSNLKPCPPRSPIDVQTP